MTDGRPETDGRRGVGELLRELADGGAALVRHEVRLARLEAGELAGTVGKGTGFVGTGGVLLLLGALAFLTGLMMLAGDQWLRDHVWLAALVVMLVAGGLAAWLARRGMRLLAPERLAPDQTVETLREDREWLKRQLTSGATSS
ncbi:MAG TPA: phage holin family protein [Gemmatimonadales bacterium]